MLGYFYQTQQTIANNDEQIKSRDNTIKKLADELIGFRTIAAANEAIIKELRQQLDLFRKSFELSLSSVKHIESLKSKLELQNTEIAQLKSQAKANSLKLKDYEKLQKLQNISADEAEFVNITITYEL